MTLSGSALFVATACVLIVGLTAGVLLEAHEAYVGKAVRRWQLREAAKEAPSGERLRCAARSILQLHNGPPNAVGNWDAAYAELADALAEEAEKARDALNDSRGKKG